MFSVMPGILASCKVKFQEAVEVVAPIMKFVSSALDFHLNSLNYDDYSTITFSPVSDYSTSSVRGQCYGPEDMFSPGPHNTLYVGDYSGSDFTVNGQLLFTVSGIEDFDISYGSGALRVLYKVGGNLYKYQQSHVHTLVAVGVGGFWSLTRLDEVHSEVSNEAVSVMAYESNSKFLLVGQHDSNYSIAAPWLDLVDGATVVEVGVLDDPDFNKVAASVQGSAIPIDYLATKRATYEYLYDIDTDGSGVVMAVYFTGYAEVSYDYGVTWAGMPRWLNSGGSGSRSLLFIRWLGGTTWIAGGSGGFSSRTVDSGVTWSSMPVGLGVSLTTMRTCSTEPGTGVAIVAGSVGRATRTDDYGVSWNSLPSGLNSGGTSNIYEVSEMVSGTAIAVLTSGYASRTTDYGVTWSALPRGLSNSSGSNSFDGNCVSLSTSGVAMAGFDSGGFSRSTDFGATWTPNQVLGEVATGFTTDNSGRWIVVSTSTVCFSRDDGLTWTRLPKFLGVPDPIDQISPNMRKSEFVGGSLLLSTSNGFLSTVGWLPDAV